MTTTDMQHEASDVEMRDDLVDTDVDEQEQASEDAQGVLAKARYEAFRLMTEARQEAEEILDEARAEAAEIKRDAEIQAESIIDAARIQASDVRKSADANSEDDETAEAVTALEQEHEELTQRVSSLRTLADQLEERFAALAATANSEPPTIEEPPRPILDYSPSVPPPPKKSEAEADDVAAEERGSFYSRRSAKLPRIGEANGKGALDVMKSIRNAFDES